MDVRQVGLGAVFGAAVAVNAALQSLQDTGSFLIQGPSSKSTSSPLPFVSPARKLIRSAAADLDREHASVFRECLNDEDDGDAFGKDDSEEQQLTPSSPSNPASQTSAGFFQEDLAVFNTTRSNGPKKLQVKRKNVDKYKAECYLKGSDEENSSTEDGDAEWGNSSSSSNIQVTRKRKAGQPMFVPLMLPMDQSEEAMPAMLQHTINNVLETLSEAKQRREQMVKEMKTHNLPEEQISLQLVSRFVDALINVSDSLTIVHAALFPKNDEP